MTKVSDADLCAVLADTGDALLPESVREGGRYRHSENAELIPRRVGPDEAADVAAKFLGSCPYRTPEHAGPRLGHVNYARFNPAHTTLSGLRGLWELAGLAGQEAAGTPLALLLAVKAPPVPSLEEFGLPADAFQQVGRRARPVSQEESERRSRYVNLRAVAESKTPGVMSAPLCLDEALESLGAAESWPATLAETRFEVSMPREAGRSSSPARGGASSPGEARLSGREAPPSDGREKAVVDFGALAMLCGHTEFLAQYLERAKARWDAETYAAELRRLARFELDWAASAVAATVRASVIGGAWVAGPGLEDAVLYEAVAAHPAAREWLPAAWRLAAESLARGANANAGGAPFSSAQLWCLYLQLLGKEADAETVGTLTGPGARWLGPVPPGLDAAAALAPPLQESLDAAPAASKDAALALLEKFHAAGVRFTAQLCQSLTNHFPARVEGRCGRLNRLLTAPPPLDPELCFQPGAAAPPVNETAVQEEVGRAGLFVRRRLDPFESLVYDRLASRDATANPTVPPTIHSGAPVL